MRRLTPVLVLLYTDRPADRDFVPLGRTSRFPPSNEAVNQGDKCHQRWKDTGECQCVRIGVRFSCGSGPSAKNYIFECEYSQCEYVATMGTPNIFISISFLKGFYLQR